MVAFPALDLLNFLGYDSGSKPGQQLPEEVRLVKLRNHQLGQCNGLQLSAAARRKRHAQPVSVEETLESPGGFPLYDGAIRESTPRRDAPCGLTISGQGVAETLYEFLRFRWARCIYLRHGVADMFQVGEHQQREVLLGLLPTQDRDTNRYLHDLLQIEPGRDRLPGGLQAAPDGVSNVLLVGGDDERHLLNREEELIASNVSTTVSGSDRSRSSTSTTTRFNGARSSDPMTSANCARKPCKVGSGSSFSFSLPSSKRSIRAPTPGRVTLSADVAASLIAFEKFTRHRDSLRVSLTLSPKPLPSSSFFCSPPRTSSMSAVVGSVLLSYSKDSQAGRRCPRAHPGAV